MKKLAFIIKNILKIWCWQDIKKSNIFYNDYEYSNGFIFKFLSLSMDVWIKLEYYIKIIYKYLRCCMFYVFLDCFIFI